MVDDLIRLRKFIPRHSPTATQRVGRRLHGAIQKLVDTLQIGRSVPDLPAEIREQIFGKYVVRYDVQINSLYIHRIWHGKKNR